MATKRVYNLKFSPEDNRDYQYLSRKRVLIPAALPPVDVTSVYPHMPSVWDQGNFGACTGFASIGAVSKYWPTLGLLSTAFQYDEERIHDGTPLSQDGG